MPIIIKNKDTLIFDDFVMKCCISKKFKNKIEGDKISKGKFVLVAYIWEETEKKIKPITELDIVYIKKKWVGVMILDQKDTTIN